MSKMSRFRIFFPAALLGLMLAAAPASAELAASKAAVDAAKAQGVVGEQGDGMLGFVNGNDAALAGAVAEINAGRAAAYRSIASKTGTSPDAAGQATAQELIAKVPAGQYYKPLGGGWTRK